MYLLATILLYGSAWSVGSLLFAYINVAFPDPLNYYYDAGGAIRWALALLIIIFPVYFWVARVLFKDTEQDAAKRDIKVRKWLLYLTLFLAALLIIGDLVALIYNFLQGEITMRFLLKVLSILAIGAAIFWYYLYDLRRAAGTFSTAAKWFIRGVLAAVVIIVVAGIVIAGSPFKQRAVRFDQQKVSDLQNIQYQIVNYWQAKGVLPKTLDDLRDPIMGFVPPQDPESGAAYTYTTSGKLSFELCAEFHYSSAEEQVGGMASRAVPAAPAPIVGTGRGGIVETWDHAAGHACFPRTIDPQRYPSKALLK